METEINPLEAKRLREAFKKTNDSDETKAPPLGDHMEVRSIAGAKHARYLVIFKDGEPIAQAEIVNSTFKRLKREWLAWNDMQSGLLTGYRKHGSCTRGF